MYPRPVSVERAGLEAEFPFDAVQRKPPPTVMPDPFAVGVEIVRMRVPCSSTTYTLSVS